MIVADCGRVEEELEAGMLPEVDVAVGVDVAVIIEEAVEDGEGVAET